ncbi:M56 family metallopeptidase [Geothrix sp. 21YS21S-4]|uniref:M56 family metallopeptidase n=1 Tax=Geothrix sp. 21YS21S-4 TaxID=3068889 RepID=UPI0027B9CCD5|nr:M56 family metallopeptidase [Geothrix sp. 21YS21S-4]
MTSLLPWLQTPSAQALGWTLLHFLWQGAALGLMAWLGMALLRGASAKARYGTACAFLVLMVAAPVATFLFLQRQVPAVPAALEGTLAAAASAPRIDAPLSLRIKAALDPALPWLLGGWAAGVLLLSGRFLGGWARIQRLRRRSASPAPAEWHLVLSRLCRELKVSRTVRLLQSAAVEVPTVLGWLRPVILLPACALAGLAPAQLEAILAHELAHIRRGDFAVNLLQSLVEVLLFYHPAVWWLSARIRAERELCCDDVAAALCGDPLLLARALTDLEALREPASLPSHRLALAANGGSLMHRVRHLLQPSLPASGGARAAALALLAASLLGAAGAVLQEKASDSKSQHSTRLKVLDGDRQMDVQVKGDVRLDATAREPVAVPGDGSFRVEEKTGGKTRAYSASKDKRTYTVDGQEKELDAEGEAWLRGAVKDTAQAQTGRETARKLRIRTAGLDDHTRDLARQTRELEAQLRSIQANPDLSSEARARTQADVEKARIEIEKNRAELEKARAEVEKHRAEIDRARAEARKIRVQVTNEGDSAETVIVRDRVHPRTGTDKRLQVLRKHAADKDGDEDIDLDLDLDLDVDLDELANLQIPPIAPVHLSKLHVQPDPHAEIQALQSAMKSLQKRLDQLQARAAAQPRPLKPLKPATLKSVPPPPVPPPAPGSRPVPPTPPAPPAPPVPED